jgi:hypothetical protein
MVQHSPQPFGIPGRVLRDFKNQSAGRFHALEKGLYDLDLHGIQVVSFVVTSSRDCCGDLIVNATTRSPFLHDIDPYYPRGVRKRKIDKR